jgi:hypothetical protein
MDISNQLNQKFFGRKELEILNQKPKPPSIKTIRKPSDVDENYNNDEGVVGYMGNDEDLESIKYDIMDNMNQKMNNFDDRIEKLLNQIQTMEANKDKLNQLELEQESLQEVVEAEENEIEAVGIEAASDGSGDINDMLDVIASARPCTALSRETESRGLIDKGDNNMCTKLYQRSSPKYGSYRREDVLYGRSCNAYYHDSVTRPIVEDPPNYCKDYNGRVAQKCNTIVGSSPSNAGPFTPDRNNCVRLNKSEGDTDKQLWVDKCSQYLGEDSCNGSDDCIFRKIGNEGKCIFNCEKLDKSLNQENINNDVKCKKENGYYGSTDIISSDSLDTSDNSVLQEYCEQFISPGTCPDKCQWDNGLDVLGYDFKCIPHEDSTTCNLSSPFQQLLKDSGEKCKSLTSSPCCGVFSEVCSYENTTCSSSLSLSWPLDPGYYNIWRIVDYSVTMLLSIWFAIALVYYLNKPKILWVVVPLLIIALKFILSLFIEKKYTDFINIGEKPTLFYYFFAGITNGLLFILSVSISLKLKRNGGDAGGESDGDGGSDDDGLGMKGKIILGFFIILVLLGFVLSVDILSTNEVKDKICGTATEYTTNNKINEYCDSINKSYDRTPEYNIAQGDDDKEFSDKCKFPCKKYSKNAEWQRLTPLITCFVIIIISLLGFKMVETSMKYAFIILSIVPISLILIGNVKSPVCKAKNKNDSEKCNSITNLDICKAALHRDGVVNEDKDNKDNKDKNICFLYHGPFWTYFSAEFIGLFLKDIVRLFIILLLVFVVSFVIIGDMPQGFKKVKEWKQGLGTAGTG